MIVIDFVLCCLVSLKLVWIVTDIYFAFFLQLLHKFRIIKFFHNPFMTIGSAYQDIIEFLLPTLQHLAILIVEIRGAHDFDILLRLDSILQSALFFFGLGLLKLNVRLINLDIKVHALRFNKAHLRLVSLQNDINVIKVFLLLFCIFSFLRCCLLLQVNCNAVDYLDLTFVDIVYASAEVICA